MDNSESMSFSSVIAGLLLCNRKVDASLVTNTLSKLSCMGIDVDDEFDDISCCVSCDKFCSFYLKDGYDYDTKLFNGVTVFKYLVSVAGDKVMSFIKDDVRYQENLKRSSLIDFPKEHNNSKVRKVRTLKKMNKLILASFLGGCLLK